MTSQPRGALRRNRHPHTDTRSTDVICIKGRESGKAARQAGLPDRQVSYNQANYTQESHSAPRTKTTSCGLTNKARGLSNPPAGCSPAKGEILRFDIPLSPDRGTPRPVLGPLPGLMVVLPIKTEARLPSDWRMRSNFLCRAVRLTSCTKVGGERWK